MRAHKHTSKSVLTEFYYDGITIRKSKFWIRHGDRAVWTPQGGRAALRNLQANATAHRAALVACRARANTGGSTSGDTTAAFCSDPTAEESVSHQYPSSETSKRNSTYGADGVEEIKSIFSSSSSPGPVPAGGRGAGAYLTTGRPHNNILFMILDRKPRVLKLPRWSSAARAQLACFDVPPVAG
ncbi:hypothetical protein EVAR_43387_1 [Eumeta japonica]|uniref:Uncharacterized protein n=1 Tax=Eumeta variegata TaxID=151549 RepID=A0A4C1WP88_EUMVA|nr:hypothetical protein EVAR_43387_1 [Eumeta japonica]